MKETMMKNRLAVSILVMSSAYVTDAFADVVINEVLGSTPGADAEFVEIYNSGTEAVDISGWTITLYESDEFVPGGSGATDSESPYVIGADGAPVSLEGQGYYLLANELAQATESFGVVADQSLPDSAIENSSYTVVLADSSGETINAIFVTDGGAEDAANIAGTAITPDGSVGPDGSFIPAGFTRTPDGADTLRLIDFTDFLTDATPMSGTDGDGPDMPPTGPETVTIMAIQGEQHRSPLEGMMVSTTGVVTAIDRNGFYLQDLQGDANPATSDALFVFTGGAPSVNVGDSLALSGAVSEFAPGGASSRNLSTTQLSSPKDILVLNTGVALPEAVQLGAAGRVPPSEVIDDDAFDSFDVDTDGIDFFESLEAMRVGVSSPLAIAPSNRFGEIFTVVDGGSAATGISERGTLNISPDDFNPEKVQIDENQNILPGFEFPDVNTGDTLSQITGVIGYDFGNFQIFPTETFTVAPAGLTGESSILSGSDAVLSIASYNMLNLDANDDDGDTDVASGRFLALANHIVSALNSPDILSLQEIQDNDGSEDSGETSAALTLQTLVDAIVEAGGPIYEFLDTEGLQDKSVGGQPGGNIRVAFLYNADRVEGPDSAIALVDPAAQSGSAFDGSRISLSADFLFNDEVVTVIGNHLSSKGGSAPIFGLAQPFDALQEDASVNGSLDERQAQASAVRDFVNGLLNMNVSANIVVLGDMNEFEFISPIKTLLGAEASLSNLTDSLGDNERYSFVFQGNSQQLDHALVSENLVDGAQFDIVHLNSEFAETPERASDHDPLLLILSFDSAPMGNAADLDANGVVNVKDYKLFARSLGSREGQRRYRVEADFDDNGRINRRDLRKYLLLYREVLATLARGDIDRDGDIDNRDRRLLFRSFGYRAGSRRYNPDADLDNNNRVNNRDFRQFIRLGH